MIYQNICTSLLTTQCELLRKFNDDGGSTGNNLSAVGGCTESISCKLPQQCDLIGGRCFDCGRIGNNIGSLELKTMNELIESDCIVGDESEEESYAFLQLFIFHLD